MKFFTKNKTNVFLDINSVSTSSTPYIDLIADANTTETSNLNGAVWVYINFLVYL